MARTSARVAARSYVDQPVVAAPAALVPALRISRRSTSRPCSWVSWPAISPPCSSPMSPTATRPCPAAPRPGRPRPPSGRSRRRAPVRRPVADAVVAERGPVERRQLEVRDQLAPGRGVDDARDRQARVLLEGRGQPWPSTRRTPRRATRPGALGMELRWTRPRRGRCCVLQRSTTVQVASPTIPSAGRPFAAWKAFTAADGRSS